MLLHQGALDQKLAEYCTAAAASLAFSPHGAVFHVCGGVSVRAREFCNALWPRHVRCMLSSSPRMDIWMTCARTACRSGWGRQALSTAWQRSCERFSMLPWTCRFMGVSTCTHNMPWNHSFIRAGTHTCMHMHTHTPSTATKKQKSQRTRVARLLAHAHAPTHGTKCTQQLHTRACRCAVYERLAKVEENHARLLGSELASAAISGAVRRYRDHPTILTICGSLIGLGPDNALPPAA